MIPHRHLWLICFHARYCHPGDVIAGEHKARAVSRDQLTIEDWQRELDVFGEGAEPRASTAPAAVAPSSVRQPTARELVETPGALLTRTHLRQLGLERRAVDAVFRALPVVALPGYSRPMIRAEEYRTLLAHCTFREDRVRPMRGRAVTGNFGG